MSQTIKVAFASGSDTLNARLIARIEALSPELPLYVVSEFPSRQGQWVPYHPVRGLRENLARCRAAFRGKRIRLAGVLLMPNMPYRQMRLIALLVAPRGFMAYNENLDHFMLRPWCAGTMLRHAAWRVTNFLRFQLNPGGDVYTFFWRLVRPRQWQRPLACLAATAAGWVAAAMKACSPRRRPALRAAPPLEAGISVVIPSRNGKELLACLLPVLVHELEDRPSEVIVVDNGSEDGSVEFLRTGYPQIIVESSRQPLSFARAVNRGLNRARFSHLCLLNNDMKLEAGFFSPLRRAFDQVPDLFCATAQILFPPASVARRPAKR